MTASVSDPVIELRGIGKRYGRTVALDGLDLTVGRGEIVGLLGPNGAGKTTAIKLLARAGPPDQRRADGSSGRRSATGPPATDRLPPGALPLPAVVAGAGGPRAPRRACRAPPRTRVPQVDRGPRARRTWPTAPTTRSARSRRGCSSAWAWASPCSARPELVLLDEPTSALDPVGRMEVRDDRPGGSRPGRDRDPQLAPADRGRARLRPRRDRRPRSRRRGRPAR